MTEYWKIDQELVEHIALISRLKLTEEEKTLYTKQLGEVMGSFRVLDDLTDLLKNEQPAFHAINFENVWRGDEPRKAKWDPLANSLEKEDDFLKGPKII
jgi:aspartyl-tRNA(Asn)/glutamyl-tRNA(Gln) amidotransferase subunit C